MTEKISQYGKNVKVVGKISKWQGSIIVAKKYQNGRKKYQSNWN